MVGMGINLSQLSSFPRNTQLFLITFFIMLFSLDLEEEKIAKHMVHTKRGLFRVNPPLYARSDAISLRPFS
jgi:hypothetical protein